MLSPFILWPSFKASRRFSCLVSGHCAVFLPCSMWAVFTAPCGAYMGLCAAPSKQAENRLAAGLLLGLFHDLPLLTLQALNNMVTLGIIEAG